MSIYGKTFYDDQERGSVESARVIVPVVMQILNPGSVVDIGCGLGTWLSVYRDHGVDDFLGVDGHYVDTSRLYIDGDRFMPHDLAKPIHLNRRFDLVQSLEVAEHIEKADAERFVDTLVSLGDAVMFGAAIPYQLGTGHVNEQFVGYWAALFAARDYRPLDCIRPRIWDNANVEVWYRQNTLLFLKANLHDAFLRDHPELRSADHPISVVHPELYNLRIRNLLNLLFELAALLHQSNSTQAAESLYQVILKHDLVCAPVHAKLGQLLADTNRLQAGLDALTRAIELNPSVAWFWDIRGRIHARMNAPDLALADFESALGVDNQYQAAREALESLLKK